MTDKFLVTRECFQVIEKLPDEEQLEIFDAMYDWMNGYEHPFGSQTLKAIFDWMLSYQSDRDAERKTPEYKKFRLAVLERDGYMCRRCGCSESVMHVHHIYPFASYPDMRTDVANGITLCPSCHREVHSERWFHPVHKIRKTDTGVDDGTARSAFHRYPDARIWRTAPGDGCVYRNGIFVHLR